MFACNEYELHICAGKHHKSYHIMKSQETTNYISKLQKLLPVGGVTRIAEELNLNQSSVSRALSGKTKNTKVIEVAIRIIEEEREKENALIQKIESL